MRNSLIYSLFSLSIYLFLAVLFANKIGAFKYPAFTYMCITCGGVVWFMLTTFVFELLDELNNWTIKLSSPFGLSQKDFLIILTQKDTIVAYYQYAQTFFKQVFSIQNQTLHSQALYFAKNSHNKYSWEEYPQTPNKRELKISYTKSFHYLSKRICTPFHKSLMPKASSLLPSIFLWFKKLEKMNFLNYSLLQILSFLSHPIHNGHPNKKRLF